MDRKKRKADVILIVLLLAFCVVIFGLIQIFVKKDGAAAVVKVDGNVVEELDLKRDNMIEVAGYNGGVNKIEVKDGKVRMTYADCPDELCVKTGWISKTGETIVCLPHRVVVEITGEGGGVDSIVQ